MNRRQITRAFILICLLSCPFSANAQQASLSQANWQVYFSPRGGATSAIVQILDNAKSNVLVQAYSFTSQPIAEAIVRAHERGVKVQVLLDKSQKTQKYTAAHFLVQAGIPVLIDDSHAIAHNKVIMIDNSIVVTGSFNFTKAAEDRNAENLLLLQSKELAACYADNWRIHQKHSTPFRQ
jgi:phosphatidylserine/phosphatidylglycerophosphate/cardiolipin synthase-like enzyme